MGLRHDDVALKREVEAALARRREDIERVLRSYGVPLITDAHAALECDIVAEHPAGDHWIVVGHVQSIVMSTLDDPLVFFAGAIGGLE